MPRKGSCEPAKVVLPLFGKMETGRIGRRPVWPESILRLASMLYSVYVTGKGGHNSSGMEDWPFGFMILMFELDKPFRPAQERAGKTAWFMSSGAGVSADEIGLQSTAQIR